MNVYAGLFLIAFSGLALQITLVRLLSVTTWYHLAFFAISTAMLGMTAGATWVYLRPAAFTPNNLANTLARNCINFAWSTLLALVLLCLIPLALYRSAMSLISLLLTTIICALPYFYSGIVSSAVLTKHNLPMGQLYASDLAGASLGCLFVLGGLELFDAPSIILLCSSTAGAACICFAWRSRTAWWRRVGLLVLLVFFLAGIANSMGKSGIRPVIVKGGRIEPTNSYYLERWNSFSRIAVYRRTHEPPQYWGPSPIAPVEPLDQFKMNIDGEAGTTVRAFETRDDIDHLRYDLTNLAYYLNRGGKACIIGVGGGRDVQSALLFGHDSVTGIEINPIFVDLLKGEFGTFAGLANRQDVDLVTAEARSYLSRFQQQCSIIQMSLIDTWAATGAGAFSLSENALYTVEAWEIFLSRLTDAGIFTVSRWHDPKAISETSRAVSLAVATLLRIGVTNPADHLVLVASDRISTLMVSRSPFSRRDLEVLSDSIDSLGFQLIQAPGHAADDPLLRRIASSRTLTELATATNASTLNCSPPTDENPYFFNMLRLRNIGAAFARTEGILRGNLIATITLLGLLATLLIVAAATIVVPLALRTYFGVKQSSSSRTLWSGAVYFSLIGAGFMLAEIALIQRLTVFLSHPIYALGILLFTLIASTGIGSWLSDRLPLTRTPWVYFYPIMTGTSLLALSHILNVLLDQMVTASIATRIFTSIVAIFPMGLMMGLFFPTGMRLAKAVCPVETPWYWALNGIFGVLCSAIAVLISIYVGISANFYLAAFCYSAVTLSQAGLIRAQLDPARQT